MKIMVDSPTQCGNMNHRKSGDTQMKIDGVKIETVGYDGSVFSDFVVERYPARGPGWYVKGHNKEKYGPGFDGRGGYVKICAWPDRPARKAKFYSCLVQHGFKTKKEAQRVADLMNNKGV